MMNTTKLIEPKETVLVNKDTAFAIAEGMKEYADELNAEILKTKKSIETKTERLAILIQRLNVLGLNINHFEEETQLNFDFDK